jgi:hypothetical protein
MQVIRTFLALTYLLSFGWISTFQLFLWTFLLLVLSTLWCAFQVYFFWDQMIQGTNMQMQEFANTIFQRVGNLSDEDLAKFKTLPFAPSDQKYLH